MASEKDFADKLLERAYNLKTEEEAKALYKDWADTYDETMLSDLGYLTPLKTAELLSTFLEDKSSRILDIGCGTGLAGAALVRRGFAHLDALDYSVEMLDVAAKREIYSNLHVADLTKEISLASDTYDAAICTGTFTHAHVGADCLDELFRILKPGALFACTIHKDVWEPAGFEAKVHQLESACIILNRHMQEGTYFENTEEPEGFYMLWEKL
ncbi:MAG: class I SAM-dependent methyltransferase [Pseudomonadota bacterium]